MRPTGLLKRLDSWLCLTDEKITPKPFILSSGSGEPRSGPVSGHMLLTASGDYPAEFVGIAPFFS